jgi:hypothetical protein
MIICHQKLIRDQRRDTDADADLFGRWWEGIDTSPDKATFQSVDHVTAKSIIEKYEWLGTYCNSPLEAFGIFWEGNCAGVVVYAAPTHTLPLSICKSQHKVCQIARGTCVHWAHPHAASMLISWSLKQMAKKGYDIAVAFSDPDAGEIGTVYQACNALYCGRTPLKVDYFEENGAKRSFVKKGQASRLNKKKRTRKHRYLFLLGSKTDKKKIRRSLCWEIEDYPKREVGND